MADWQAIKQEYITTNTSYRKLGQKHGVGYSVIGERASAEGWVEQREQFRNDTLTKAMDAICMRRVDRAANLVSVADLLLDKIKSLVESDAEVLYDTQSLKHISGVLKDIKEVQMIRSEKDLEEQDARIAKLRKEAEREETESEIVITFGNGGKKEWAE